MLSSIEAYRRAIREIGEKKGEVYYLDALDQEIKRSFEANITPEDFVKQNRSVLLTKPKPSAAPIMDWFNPRSSGSVSASAVGSAEPSTGAVDLREKERLDLMNYSCRMKAWAVAFWWNVVVLLIFLYLQHGAEMRVRQLCLEDGIDGTTFIQNIKREYRETFVIAFVLGTLALPLIWLMMVGFLAAVAASAVNINRF